MDHDVRRSLVAGFPTFLARCTRGHAALDSLAERHKLPAYLVGLLNTAFLSAERWPMTEAMLRDAQPYSTRSRVGAEHWAALVVGGFASPAAGGWTLTAAGMAVVLELHRELRLEIARRATSSPAVDRVRRSLAPIAELVPAIPRIRAVRRLWTGRGDAPGIVDLYRAIWELSIHRDVRHRLAWEAMAYTGPVVDALTQAWAGADDRDEVARRLATKQSLESVDESLRVLARRGDVELTGHAIALTTQGRAARDAIERRTDEAYFVHWPTGVTLAELRESFDSVMRELESEPSSILTAS